LAAELLPQLSIDNNFQEIDSSHVRKQRIRNSRHALTRRHAGLCIHVFSLVPTEYIQQFNNAFFTHFGKSLLRAIIIIINIIFYSARALPARLNKKT